MHLIPGQLLRPTPVSGGWAQKQQAPEFLQRQQNSNSTIDDGNPCCQCLPKLHMPGALLAGDCAGFLVAARIKGAHTAMKTGMLAAEAIAQQADEIFAPEAKSLDLSNYDWKFKTSWVYEEMYKYREQVLNGCVKSGNFFLMKLGCVDGSLGEKWLRLGNLKEISVQL